MNREELEEKYGKELIDKLFGEGYLSGTAVNVNKDGLEDFLEEDILLAIKKLRDEK